MLCSINATAKKGVCPEMKTNIQTAVSMSTMRGLTKVLAAIGDPIGRLETAPDLAEFSAGLREKTVQKSRIGVLVSADYEICAEVLKSPNWRTVAEPGNFLEEIFLGSSSQSSENVDIFLDSILGKDGDEHSRIKKLVVPAFTHRAMQSWKETADKIAYKLVQQLPSDGRVDLVSTLANPLPLEMICEILGVPLKDRELFNKWGNSLAEIGLDGPRTVGQVSELEIASKELTDYMAELLAYRRKHPEDDLLTSLANSETDGITLTDREIVATASFLLLAGFETTVNLLGAGTRVLVEHKEALKEVSQNHDLIPNLVEEALRYVSPVQYTFRSSASEVVLKDGTVVKKGQSIVLMIVGANRDPQIFSDPDTFDIHRENAKRNLAFGYGAHHCLGASLARLEAEAVWKHLLLRFPNVASWKVNGEVVTKRGRVIRGLETLPMRLGEADSNYQSVTGS
jgi:cytochrome P450